MWGLFGGFAVEGLELYAAVRHAGQWPWKRPIQPRTGEVPEAGVKGYVIAEVIRLVIGAGLAWAAASTGQIAGPLGALGVGVAAPTIIGQLAKVIPLTISADLPDTPDSRVPVSAGSSREHEASRFPAIDTAGAAEAVE